MNTEIDLGYNYEKMTSSLRGYYSGADYYGALIMLDRAREVHSGTRRNGFPEYSHQIMQASVLRTLPGLIDPEIIHICVLGHDLEEDHDVSVDSSITAIVRGVPKGWAHIGDIEAICGALKAMNKYYTRLDSDLVSQGSTGRHQKPTGTYYTNLSVSSHASIAKGLDRDHNLSLMMDVFNLKKMGRYIAETREYVLPMLKSARKLFPSQEPAYQNLRHQINYKIHMAEKWITMKEKLSEAGWTLELLTNRG